MAISAGLGAMLAAGIGGGLNLLGGLANSMFANAANSKQMDFNARQAAIHRNWLERMANTAHQREVEDLRAAGLNPILSATGGTGAATPAASAASVGQLHAPQFDFSSALQAYSMARDISRQDRLADAEIELKMAEANRSRVSATNDTLRTYARRDEVDNRTMDNKFERELRSRLLNEQLRSQEFLTLRSLSQANEHFSARHALEQQRYRESIRQFERSHRQRKREARHLTRYQNWRLGSDYLHAAGSAAAGFAGGYPSALRGYQMHQYLTNPRSPIGFGY